ncbi:hypothetical protein E9531_15955 [Lampropedia puyangensis]|uniref:IPTL-CTERM sorting domain-containing protein n=1 Tax=Lampropedia puyangensis TaxID=1330072 RepID=A0A4S8ETB7_9BURK|nr:hypothetical protein [Lampropedia puyangensis]THT97470.1 hypothetical protein E9531_15955 [Lampropedia puyangensis]
MQTDVADYTDITTIPGLPNHVDGSITSNVPLRKYTLPSTWDQTWQSQISGPIFVGSDITLTLPPRTTAFHVYASPNGSATSNITAIATSSVVGAPTSPLVEAVTATHDPATPDPIPGFGFYTSLPEEYITSVRLFSDGGGTAHNAVAMGLFGIAQAPAAPTVAAIGHDGTHGWVHITPPQDMGTHSILERSQAYVITCENSLGMLTTSTMNPVRLPEGAAIGDKCIVSAWSDAGQGDGAEIIVAAGILHTIGGSITGLTASGLTLANGENVLFVSSNATAFRFNQPVQPNNPYNVTIQTQPTGQTCTVTNGQGQATADVTDIQIHCLTDLTTPGGATGATPVPLNAPWAIGLLAAALGMFGWRHVQRKKSLTR